MFEVHITVQSLKNSELEQFKQFCKQIGAKPILIALPKGRMTQQAMISKVFTGLVEGQLGQEIKQLKAQFVDAGYEIIRTKVEVPLEYIAMGVKEFPDYHGQYFEWHGKVEFDEIEHLQGAIRYLDAHISRNGLKDENNRRFVTVRAYHTQRFFMNKVDTVVQALEHHGLKLVKQAYEYCIYDSNRAIDSGWVDTPEITDRNYLNLLAFEGFLRRSVDQEDKFILKGSILTRQYLKDKAYRNVGDLDYIYGEALSDDKDAEAVFSHWVTKVTEAVVEDNIVYKSFKENEFWRGIDYAMNDDFPTTNTDLSCLIDGRETLEFGLDISWNLPLEEQAIPLKYKAINGDEFIVPYTVPLATQIAWKLHQSIVRPRAKDFLDIVLLLESNKLTKEQVEMIVHVYTKECLKDNIDPSRILYYTSGKVSVFLENKRKDLDAIFKSYRPFRTPFGFDITVAMQIAFLDNTFKLDHSFDDIQGLTKVFENSLRRLGFKSKLVNLE